MKINRFFITGTDTGVGKTIVSTVLSVGLGASYWKPIQTGACEGSDSDFVRRWIGSRRVWPESYLLQEPVSPHLAAQAENRGIEISKCMSDFFHLSGPLIVEGAGGVLVPVNSSHYMVDLIRGFELATILVTSTRLGTINHTLLSLEALRARGVRVEGFIMVGTEEESARRSISSYGNVRFIGHVPTYEVFTMSWIHEVFSTLSIETESR